MRLENSDVFNPIGTQESLEAIDTHATGGIRQDLSARQK